MAYRSVDGASRWKAMLASFALTGILGAVLVSGLNVQTVRHAIDHLRTFDISLPKPPPPEPPPPPKPRQAKKAEGAPAAPKASPIVAPKPEVVLPTRQVIAAAAQPGTGASSANGQGGVGNGNGAGGTGNGLGGGAGFTPARKITKIPDREYRRLVSISGMERGSVGISIRVTPEGQATACKVIRSSGSPPADSLMCQLTEQYVRFRPALDPSGRPVAQQISWFPNWSRR